MDFEYVASTREGASRQGMVEAGSVRDAVAALKARGLIVISVRARKTTRARPAFGRRLVRISATERVLLARHLALILRAGIPIDRAIDILRAHGKNKGLQRVLEELVGLIRKGESFAVALARYPAVFPPLFVAIVRWGEIGGTLVESLEHLAAQMEKDYDLRSKVRGAFVYPAIVIVATFGVGIVMAVFILPRLVSLFESFKVDLPLSTRIFLAAARFVQRRGLLLLPAVILLPLAAVFLLRRPALRPFAHRLLLRLPVFGPLVRQVNLARFDRIFGSLLRSGIPVVDALRITRDSLGSIPYRRALTSVVESARQGMPVSRELENVPLFPSLQVQMIAVGEETGRLADVLLYLAEFTERDVDTRTKNLATAIEPMLLLAIGLLVGGVAVAVITPIYQLTSSFSR